jgi:hypothetical protein
VYDIQQFALLARPLFHEKPLRVARHVKEAPPLLQVGLVSRAVPRDFALTLTLFPSPILRYPLEESPVKRLA